MGDNAARRLATGQGTCPRGSGGGGGKALHTRSALDQALDQASCAPPPPAPLGSGASLCGRARRKRGGNSETGNSEPRHALRRARVPFSLQSRARLPGDLVVPRQGKPAPWASIRQAVGRHTKPQARSERTAAAVAAAAAAALESVGWIAKCVCCRDGHKCQQAALPSHPPDHHCICGAPLHRALAVGAPRRGTHRSRRTLGPAAHLSPYETKRLCKKADGHRSNTQRAAGWHRCAGVRWPLGDTPDDCASLC